MVVWKSVARQAAAAMIATRLITPKSTTAIPAGRATNLLQRRSFSNGGDHQGPTKDEILKFIRDISLITLVQVDMYWKYELIKGKNDKKEEEKVEVFH